MVGCVFLSQNWAPLVKKIYKWLAAFFCPKIGHHSLNSQISQNWAPLVKKFTFFLAKKKIIVYTCWLRFFVTPETNNRFSPMNLL